MDLHGMTDSALLAGTWSVAQDEIGLGITRRLLAHLDEVERRRLYLRRGYGSLWVWACADLGYSEAEAKLRVEALRALRVNQAFRDLRGAPPRGLRTAASPTPVLAGNPFKSRRVRVRIRPPMKVV